MVYISLGRRDNLAQHARPPCFFTCVLASFIGLNHGRACRNLPKSWYKLVKPSARGVSESWSQSERRCHRRAPDGQTTAGLAPKKWGSLPPYEIAILWQNSGKPWDYMTNSGILTDKPSSTRRVLYWLMSVPNDYPVSQVMSHKEMINGSTRESQESTATWPRDSDWYTHPIRPLIEGFMYPEDIYWQAIIAYVMQLYPGPITFPRYSHDIPIISQSYPHDISAISHSIPIYIPMLFP